MITKEQINQWSKAANNAMPTIAGPDGAIPWLQAFAQLAYAKGLEDAAKECERMMMYPGGRCEAPAHDNVWEAAKAIRALTLHEQVKS